MMTARTSTARSKNDTHASTSDPEGRLYRKAAGREVRLCYMGHAMDRHELAVSGMVTVQDQHSKRELAGHLF